MTQRGTRANGTFQSAVDNIEREFQRLQKEVQSRSRSLEKRLTKGRKTLEARGRKLEARSRKQIRGLVNDLRKNPVVKRAASLRDEAAKQIETGIETVLGTFQIASKSELERIDRKLRAVNKKLQAIDKARVPRTPRPQERHIASV